MFINNIGKSNYNPLLITFIFFFLLVTLFDPADILLGIKVPLFVLCLAVTLFICFTQHGRTKLSVGLVIYILLMISIPLVSIYIYYISNGQLPYEGLQMMKAYIFISFALVLYLTGLDIIRYLSFALSILAMAIIFLAIFLALFPSYFMPLYLLGMEVELFYLGTQDYGSNLKISRVFFATSPMLAISIAYYFYLAKFSTNKKWTYAVITLLHISAMFLAGTRNTMFVALLLPFSLYLLFGQRKLLNGILGIAAACCFVLVFSEQLLILLDPSERNNSIKLGYLGEYREIFLNTRDLIFGQGLGAYHFWESFNMSYYITELTYLEVLRNFGFFLGLAMICLLIYPIFPTLLSHKKYKEEKFLVVAYIYYLIMSITNPTLFSSMGMLILSIIVANAFLVKNQYEKENKLISD